MTDPKQQPEQHLEEEVIIEAETDADMVRGANSLSKGEASQVAKLKKKLKESDAKAKEYLDGWQRLKADTANTRKGESERLAKSKQQATEAVLESLLPALDSFDAAMQGEGWEAVDGAWRQGMEFVHGQLTAALAEHNVASFGAAGDAFDPARYEAAEGEGEKVIKVLRKGYTIGAQVLRPARVIVE